MKIERYTVEIEMPDGDMASSVWVCDTLQNESDIEDKGRWKVSVKEQRKPSEAQMKALHDLNLTGGISYAGQGQELINLYNELKKLKG